MNADCPKCNTANPGGSRFCCECGTSLAATLVQGRTIAMAATAVSSAVDACRTRIQNTLASEAQCGQREDTFLVTDYSGSMGAEFDVGVLKLEAAQRACVNLVLNKHQIDPDDRIGLIGFDHKATLLLGLTALRENKPDIIRCIQGMRVCGGTDIKAGLVAARQHFDWTSADTVRRIVLLTDGHGGNPVRTAQQLKDSGVVLDVIGIGSSPSDVKERLLRKLASVVEGQCRYRFIKDHQTLVQHYTQLANKTHVGV